MGGKGSGATKRGYELRRILGASEKQMTAETKNFVRRLKVQAGDHMFSVDRKYPNGEWFNVGTVADAREEIVGEAFGGGSYRLYELHPSTEERSDKPPLVMKLSPAVYKIKKRFATPPDVAEDHALTGFEGEDFGRGPGPVDTASIAAQIEARLRREYEQQAQVKELQSELRHLNEKMLTFTMPQPAAPGSHLAEMREMLALFRELTPPPAMGLMTPTSPLEGVRQSIELIKTMQTELGGIAGGTPKGNPVLEKLTDSLMTLGTQAIGAYQRNKHTPTPTRRLVPAGGGRQQQQQGEAGAEHELTQAEMKEQMDRDFQMMINELQQRLLHDQADQLSEKPATHISETAAWFRSRWTGPEAPTVWVNLRETFARFPDSQVVAYLGSQVPALMAQEKGKAWLASLVEILRKN